LQSRVFERSLGARLPKDEERRDFDRNFFLYEEIEMKIRSVAAAIALAFVAGSAAAADLASVASPPPPPPPPPPPLWTGFYGGLNAGYSWGASTDVEVATGQIYDFFAVNPLGLLPDPSSALSALAATGRANVRREGFIGGGQIGYNYQFYNRFVLGLEADIQGADIRGNGSFLGSHAWNAFAAPIIGPLGLFLDRSAVSGAAVSARTDWLGTVRGRLGYAATPTLLVYATGGLAYGGAQARIFQSQFVDNTLSLILAGAPVASLNAPFASLGGFAHYNETRVGWTVGGGLEWLFSPNFSVKAEYLYYDLGTASIPSSPLASVGSPGVFVGPLPFFGTINQSVTRVKFDGHIARVGINYHLNFAPPEPVLAKY
jgi:outer membrane immunogenic protein